MTDLLIVQSFKDASLSASQIAKRFHVSDTYAIYTFQRYVDMRRNPLTTAICIDEVHLAISKVCKYALVIQDFATGEPIDLVINRRKEITDMYRPYINYVDSYFPNAISVVDSFHVIKMITGRLQAYLRRILRNLHEKDEQRHAKLEQEFGRKIGFVHSREYYLVKNFQWLILKNRSEIKYSVKSHFDYKFNCFMSVYDYEHELFKIDQNLAVFRDLKEMYIDFDNKYVGRLSNGPMESLNRIPKDMKRHARGYGNFEHIRNRFLFSQRKNAAILAVPKAWKDVCFRTDNTRGPYKKHAVKGPKLR